jgi:hypothetical protein
MQCPDLLIEMGEMMAVAVVLFNKLWAAKPPSLKKGTGSTRERRLLCSIARNLAAAAIVSRYRCQCVDRAKEVRQQLRLDEGRHVALTLFALYEFVDN